MGKTQINDITTELENAEVTTFGKRDLRAFNTLKCNIEKGFTKASDAYITIGCSLWQIHHNEFYRIDNYKNIAEFALDCFELKKATTHNYIKVIEKFGEIVDGKALGLKEEYKPFKCSQLVNMTAFTPEQLEQVKPDWTVKQIIEFGKNSLALEESEDAEAPKEDDENVIDGEAEEMDATAYMTVPELETGRTQLITCDSFDDLIENREVLENAFNDMKQDKNFAKKKIRFVLELAFD